MQSIEHKDKCLKCGKKVANAFWSYQYSKKTGFMCEECGEWFHIVGQYLSDAAAKILKEKEIEVTCNKEKFGIWMLYFGELNVNQEEEIKNLREQYEKMFPEFSWCWD